MFNLYKKVRTNGSLTKSNYYEQMAVAVTQIGLDSCLSGERFPFWASFNGIDND
jgi:hypothetical protein